MNVNEPGRSKLGQGRNSWQWAKYAWRYSDLLEALKGKHLSALLRNRGGINFCVICTPLQDIRKEHFDPAKFQ